MSKQEAKEKLLGYDVFLADSSLLTPLACEEKPKIIICCPNQKAMDDMQDTLQALAELEKPAEAPELQIEKWQHEGDVTALVCHIRGLETYIQKRQSTSEYDEGRSNADAALKEENKRLKGALCKIWKSSNLGQTPDTKSHEEMIVLLNKIWRIVWDLRLPTLQDLAEYKGRLMKPRKASEIKEK